MRGVSSLLRAVARQSAGALGSDARPAAACGDGAAALRALTQLTGLQQSWQQQAGYASWRGKVPSRSGDDESDDDEEAAEAHAARRRRAREERIRKLVSGPFYGKPSGVESFVEG